MENIQTTIELNKINNPKQAKIMKSIDNMNNRFGKNIIRFASTGILQEWQMKQAHKTPAFTTNWHEILVVS